MRYIMARHKISISRGTVTQRAHREEVTGKMASAPGRVHRQEHKIKEMALNKCRRASPHQSAERSVV
jgi:hypothetical protein